MTGRAAWLARGLAVAGTLLMNGVLVLSLAWASRSANNGREPELRTVVQAVKPPEPPPPPEPEPEPEPTPLQLQPSAALAPIEPSPLPRSLTSIPVPKTDRRLLDWSSGFALPTYVAAGSGEADMKEAMAVERAQLLFQPDLARYYPRGALSSRLKGRTVVRLQVSARGNVTAVDVLRSEPPGWFDEAAVRAAKQIRFRPAKRNGRRQASVVPLVLEWKPPEESL
ncbi:MAG: energy transducer TonB [Myxococcota bacterium]